MDIYISQRKPLSRRRERGWGEGTCVDKHENRVDRLLPIFFCVHQMTIDSLANALTPTPLPPAGEGLFMTCVDTHA